MTKQEVFDKVVAHLLSMKERSVSGLLDICAYRGDNGNKCAVGCLISDEIYSGDLEGKSVEHELVRAALVLSGVGEDSFFLLERLQSIHDESSYWGKSGFGNREGLRHIAEAYVVSDAAVPKEEV